MAHRSWRVGTLVETQSLCSIVLGLSLSACGGYSNEPVAGVRGMSWGSFEADGLKPSRDFSLVKLEGAGGCSGCVVYEGPGRPGAFEGIAVDGEFYVERNGRLAAVILMLEGGQAEALDTALQSRFGSPTATEEQGPYTSSFWRGDTVLIELRRGGYFGNDTDMLLFEHLPTSTES